MHLPTPGADLSTVLPRLFRNRRAGIPAALVALVVATGAAAAGCRDEAQADSPAPTLAPSAPQGLQSAPVGKCIPAADIAAFLTLTDDFPLCVVGKHLVTYGGDKPEDPPWSSYGQPSWAKDDTYDGPFTGGACQRFRDVPPAVDANGDGKDDRDDGDDCATAVEHWSIGASRDAVPVRSHNRLTAGTIPAETAFSALAYVPVGKVNLTLVTHTSAQAAREGEAYLVRASSNPSEQFFIAASVNGVRGVALPAKPSASQVFFYNGESPLYVFDPPTAKASGLYRAACDFEADPRACTSTLVAAWEDSPGLVASDVDGNVVAVHSGLVTGQTLVGFAAASLSGQTDGTALEIDNPTGSTTSLTVIGAAGQPKNLVAVGTNGAGQPREVKLLPITFEASGSKLGAAAPGSFSAAGGARLQVFHDPQGELWIAVDSNGSAPGGQLAFLHLAPRT